MVTDTEFARAIDHANRIAASGATDDGALRVETIARPWTESGAVSALPYVARIDGVFLRQADGDLRRFKTREAAERAAGREAARRAPEDPSQ